MSRQCSLLSGSEIHSACYKNHCELASVLATEQELSEKVKFQSKSVEGDKRGRADVGEQECFYPNK